MLTADEGLCGWNVHYLLIFCILCSEVFLFILDLPVPPPPCPLLISPFCSPFFIFCSWHVKSSQDWLLIFCWCRLCGFWLNQSSWISTSGGLLQGSTKLCWCCSSSASAGVSVFVCKCPCCHYVSMLSYLCDFSRWVSLLHRPVLALPPYVL